MLSANDGLIQFRRLDERVNGLTLWQVRCVTVRLLSCLVVEFDIVYNHHISAWSSIPICSRQLFSANNEPCFYQSVTKRRPHFFGRITSLMYFIFWLIKRIKNTYMHTRLSHRKAETSLFNLLRSCQNSFALSTLISRFRVILPKKNYIFNLVTNNKKNS